MKNIFSALIIIFTLTSCATTEVKQEYAELKVTNGEMLSTKWSGLNRFPAGYPKKAVIKSLEGCATIEYVITPENEIKDITIITETNSIFGKSATNVVKNWKWAGLPTQIISKAVKTQTTFDFCFNKAGKQCSTIQVKNSCSSNDVIYSRGMMVR